MSNMEMVMTLVTNECECIASGECTCDNYLCECECGCENCIEEYVSEDANVSECGCGGNCACGT